MKSIYVRLASSTSTSKREESDASRSGDRSIVNQCHELECAFFSLMPCYALLRTATSMLARSSSRIIIRLPHVINIGLDDPAEVSPVTPTLRYHDAMGVIVRSYPEHSTCHLLCPPNIPLKHLYYFIGPPCRHLCSTNTSRECSNTRSF
jgi:hypothetical protein